MKMMKEIDGLRLDCVLKSYKMSIKILNTFILFIINDTID